MDKFNNILETGECRIDDLEDNPEEISHDTAQRDRDQKTKTKKQKERERQRKKKEKCGG